jgi:hypothetical protein
MRRIAGRAIYVATAVAVVALIGGFAIASIALTSTSQNAQGNYVSSTGAVTGLTYTSTVLNSTNSPPPPASSGTAAAPQALVASENAFCASPTCTAADFAQTVTYTFTASMTGSVQITIHVTATFDGGAATIYLKNSAAVAGTIVLTWDLGTATSTLNGVTLAAQQCTGAGGTCP